MACDPMLHAESVIRVYTAGNYVVVTIGFFFFFFLA